MYPEAFSLVRRPRAPVPPLAPLEPPLSPSPDTYPFIFLSLHPSIPSIPFLPMPSPLALPKIVDKPWGREIWYADQKAYAGKILEVKAGRRLSLQYHERKTETLYLLSGHVRLTFRPTEEGEAHAAAIVGADHVHDWKPGQLVHIPARTIHRFEAVVDSVLLEVSTPDLADVVRLQDDYARPERD